MELIPSFAVVVNTGVPQYMDSIFLLLMTVLTVIFTVYFELKGFRRLHWIWIVFWLMIFTGLLFSWGFIVWLVQPNAEIYTPLTVLWETTGDIVALWILMQYTSIMVFAPLFLNFSVIAILGFFRRHIIKLPVEKIE